MENNINRYFDDSENIQQFSENYFKYIYQLLNNLNKNEISSFAEELEKARQNNNTIFFVGNGGSAATASHMSNDIGTDIRKKGGSDLPFRAMSLSDSTPIITAIGNDDGYEQVFVNQLRIHYRKGDKLVAISASGNSPNLVSAAEWVKEHEGTVLSLVGFDGGKLKEISDVTIHVKSHKGEYGPVEDVHMIMDHLIANWLQCKVQKEQN